MKIPVHISEVLFCLQIHSLGFATPSLIGLLCVFNDRLWMMLLVAISAFSAWSYSLKPLQSSYRGFGEFHQGISCGMLLPVTAFYLQSGTLQGFPWLVLAPLFLIFYAGNIITALLDFPSDTEGGKLTYPVRHNEKKARRDALLILTVAYLLCGILTSAVTASEGAFTLITLGLILGPALGLLFYIANTGLLARSDVKNQSACRKFVALTTISQIWVMVTWTASIFYLSIS